MIFKELPDSAEDIIKKILEENPAGPTDGRAPHGFWAEPSRVVLGLVSAGYRITKAVDMTLEKMKMIRTVSNRSSLRSAYYNHLRATRSKTSVK